MHRIMSAVIFLASVNSASAVEPIGEWLVANGAARIKIDNCGRALWGVVSWEKQPGRDQNNPDPAKRDRPTLGMPILLNMKPSENNKWEGEVYNSENGKTYSSSIRLTGPDALRIEGCVLGFLCGGETWTRVKMPDPVPVPRGRSTATPPAVPAPPAVDVCSNVPRVSGAAHERGLK